jgi:hypothetical protein
MRIRRVLTDPHADICQALEKRRANLDRRVESGEISRSTRARYLQDYKMQLIDSLGYGRPRWPERTLAAVLAPWPPKD